MTELKINDIPGVGESTAEKLMASGYDTIMGIAVASPLELANTVGMSETVCRKMINWCRNEADLGFKSGTEEVKRRDGRYRIPTGARELDLILLPPAERDELEKSKEPLVGGMISGSMTETYGLPGCGKTGIGFSLAVNLLCSDPKACVAYIDAEFTFNHDRIRELVAGYNERCNTKCDPEEVIGRIQYLAAHNSDHQLLAIQQVNSLITKEGFNIKLVIVDSIIAHLRAELVGRATLSVRQSKLAKHVSALNKIADVHNIVVYVTNQAMSDPGAMFGDPTRAVGGNVLQHGVKTIIFLRKAAGGKRKATITKSAGLAELDALYEIKTGGLY